MGAVALRKELEHVDIIECKDKLTLLGATFEENSMNWDTQFEYLLSRTSSRLLLFLGCVDITNILSVV